MINRMREGLMGRLLGLRRYGYSKKASDDELTLEEMSQLLGYQIERPHPKQGLVHSVAQQKSQQIIENDSNYFYGLMPKFNQNFPICKDPNEIQISDTPNQNIFHALQLPDNCSFQDYTIALKKFRTETDLYGDEQDYDVILNSDLEFKSLLAPDSKYLERARSRAMVNISIPGTIEAEDPRNFMDLRPVEQFRHTPLVPISESALQKHQQMLERYHRKQFVFEVSTESVLNWGLMAGCLGVGGYLLYLVLQKEEERTVAFSRMKYQRIIGESVDTPVFRI